MIDNYVNNLCNIMNNMGLEYDSMLPKLEYQHARNEIKHFIENCGYLVKKEKYNEFKDYCRLTFEKYLPKEV